MNKNITPIILLVLAIGIYFTFTKGKIDALKSIQNENTEYQKAINNSRELIKVRDKVRDTYNNISAEDRTRLGKMMPDNIDNVRLIIDINGIGANHGLYLKNIKTDAIADDSKTTNNTLIKNNTNLPSSYETVNVSFGVNTDYQTFIEFLGDLENSLRILDISKITLSANDTKNYDYSVELKTYWLKK